MIQNNLFIITKNDKISYEEYLTKLVKKLKYKPYITIQTPSGCQEFTNSIVNDILGVGGWIKEYEEKKKITRQNKEKKEYELEIYEFYIKRDIHNPIKNV